MIWHQVISYGSNPNFVCIVSNEGKRQDLICSIEQYNQGVLDYNNGVLIQNAFPFLSDDEREFLITGWTVDELDELYTYCGYSWIY